MAKAKRGKSGSASEARWESELVQIQFTEVII